MIILTNTETICWTRTVEVCITSRLYIRSTPYPHPHPQPYPTYQSSLLGPIYPAHSGYIVRLIEHHGLCPHLFADNSQVYGRCWAAWMLSNRLQLNADKTELIWWSTSRHLNSVRPPRSRSSNLHIRFAFSATRRILRYWRPRHDVKLHPHFHCHCM